MTEGLTRDGRLLVAGAVGTYMVFVLLMVVLVDVPPLLDYPNHFSRIWLLSGGVDLAPVSSMYEIDWQRASTNIGIDLIAFWLGPIFGAETIAKSALYLAIILPPLGAIALNRTVFGQWNLWQIGMLFASWCATMMGGFVNFQISLGLALLFATADLKLRRFGQIVIFPYRALAFGFILVDHIFGACFFALIVGALYASRIKSVFQDRAAFLRFLMQMLLAAAAFAIPIAIFLYADSALLKGRTGQLSVVWKDSLALQIANLMSALESYYLLIDVLFVSLILLAVQRLRKSAAGEIHHGLLLAMLLLLLIAIISPLHAVATGWISWRFPIMALLLAFAMYLPPPVVTRRDLTVAAILLLTATFGRTFWVAGNWYIYQSDVRDVRTVLNDVPAGSSVLATRYGLWTGPSPAFSPRTSSWSEDTYRHLATLAVPYAKSFVPTLFTAKGKQPIKVKPAWIDSDVPEGNLIPITALACNNIPLSMYLSGPPDPEWRKKFDYILVFDADVPENAERFVPGGLTLVRKTHFVELYKVSSQSWLAPQNAKYEETCEKLLEARLNDT